jgi:hypothetical protein
MHPQVGGRSRLAWVKPYTHGCWVGRTGCSPDRYWLASAAAIKSLIHSAGRIAFFMSRGLSLQRRNFQLRSLVACFEAAIHALPSNELKFRDCSRGRA